MKISWAANLLTLGLIAVAVVILTGCEDDDLGNAQFSISPAHHTMGTNDTSVVLTAVGGQDPFTWSVSDATLGTVTGTVRTVTYTRLPNVTGANTVTVRDSQGWTASAVIVQPAAIAGDVALTIDPTTATLSSDGDKAVFSGKNGKPPYTWSVGIPQRGSIAVLGSSQGTYTRLLSGNNTVIVTDADGHVAVAQVSQPTASPLTITPATTTLSDDGDMAVFTATDGTPPYSWDVGDSSRGSVVSMNSTQARYTRNLTGNNSVIVADSAGHVAVAQISQPTLAPLAVSPSTATVAITNGTQVLSVSGGTGTYTWSFAGTPSGTISPTTGANTLYTSTGPGADVVQVTDGQTTTFATLNKQ